MLTEAVRLPLAEGVNITSIMQLAPAATELPQVSAVSAKSLALVPVTARLVMLKVALPVLFSVTVCAELGISTGWLPKARLVGERLTMGPPTVKLTEFDAPPPGAGLLTTTAYVPAVAWSLVLKLIVNCVELTNVGVWATVL
jgi:hypothetical protein